MVFSRIREHRQEIEDAQYKKTNRDQTRKRRLPDSLDISVKRHNASIAYLVVEEIGIQETSTKVRVALQTESAVVQNASDQ